VLLSLFQQKAGLYENKMKIIVDPLLEEKSKMILGNKGLRAII